MTARTVIVNGDCMIPTLRRGERVTVLRGATARVGDVVLLNTAHGAMLHRLLLRLPFGYVIHAGDAGVEAGVGKARQVVGTAPDHWAWPGVTRIVGMSAIAIARDLAARARRRLTPVGQAPR